MNNNKNPLIFVVEDNHVYSRLIVSFLKTNKYTNVEVFSTGEEAVKAMPRQPMVVIQDYLLEGMNGIEVLKKTKTVAPKAEFIFLSGQDNIDVAINTIKYGAFDYIVKDQMALKKLVTKINKIQTFHNMEVSQKRFKTGVVLFFVVLILFIIALATVAIIYPQYFGLSIKG